MVEARQAEIENGQESPTRYSIDLKWYREQSRSFITFASGRLCSASHSKTALKSEQSLLNAFKQCCSKRDNFVTMNMTLPEIIFRAFLADANQPLNLDQLQSKIGQWLADSTNPRDISIFKLKRVIENDSYYGLRPVPSVGNAE